MRVIVFLSRFAFICNIAFLMFVFFGWWETRKPVKASADTVLHIPFAKELIITLGFTAILINLATIIIYVIILLSGKIKFIPRWLVIANVLFLLLQVYYFFLA